MRNRGIPTAELVASSTTAAVHRRDHNHAEDTCHPHVVEVVGLGSYAIAVCHDCASDTGFLDHRDAETVAGRHRKQTA